MSLKRNRTIGPCRDVTRFYCCCGHMISSFLFISILAFVPSFSSLSMHLFWITCGHWDQCFMPPFSILLHFGGMLWHLLRGWRRIHKTMRWVRIFQILLVINEVFVLVERSSYKSEIPPGGWPWGHQRWGRQGGASLSLQWVLDIFQRALLQISVAVPGMAAPIPLSHLLAAWKWDRPSQVPSRSEWCSVICIKCDRCSWVIAVMREVLSQGVNEQCLPQIFIELGIIWDVRTVLLSWKLITRHVDLLSILRCCAKPVAGMEYSSISSSRARCPLLYESVRQGAWWLQGSSFWVGHCAAFSFGSFNL